MTDWELWRRLRIKLQRFCSAPVTSCWSCLKTSTMPVSWTDSLVSLLARSAEWRLNSAHRSNISHRLPQASPTKAPHTQLGRTVRWPWTEQSTPGSNWESWDAPAKSCWIHNPERKQSHQNDGRESAVGGRFHSLLSPWCLSTTCRGEMGTEILFFCFWFLFDISPKMYSAMFCNKVSVSLHFPICLIHSFIFYTHRQYTLTNKHTETCFVC